MRGLTHDLREAARTARRHRGFASLVMATVALGIGLNAAVFSLVDALLLRPPAIADPERLVHVYSAVPGDILSHGPMAFPDYETLRDQARSFAGVAAYAWFPLALQTGDGSELLLAEAVSGGYFATLGVAPVLGRVLTEAEDRPGAPSAAVVLSHECWQRRFAGAADVLGRELRLNGRVFTVVGVAPSGFRSLVPGLAPDLWLPIRSAAALPAGVTIALGGVTPGVERTEDRAQRWVWVAGRLRPEASAAQADAEVALLASRLAPELPATQARRRFTAVPAGDVRLLPGLDGALWSGSLLVTAVFVLGLLLASINVAGLFLARGLDRRREIATRLALGARRGRLVRQLFGEGLILALAGGALGLVLTHLSNQALARFSLPLPAGVNWPLEIALAPALDARVLVCALSASVLAAVVFALLPAVEATRADLAGMLRAGCGAATRPRRLAHALVAAQVAVSAMLLTGAAIASRSLHAASKIDPGFEAGNAAVVTLSPDLLGYSWEDMERFFLQARERVSALPGVRSATLASHLPLTAAINIGNVAPAHSDAAETLVDSASVGPGYFETMGVRLVAGRAFLESDGPATARTVIVNETLARQFWPGVSPLGRRLRNGAEVVGVARDGRYRLLGERPRPFLYTALRQDPRGTRTLVARTEGDPRPLLTAIRATVRELDPRVPLSAVRTLDDTLDGALWVPRAAVVVLGFFAVVGLLVSSIGTFGVVACVASAGTREMGLRVALGATPGRILAWLFRRGMAPVAAGLVLGLTGAAAVNGALSDEVPGVRGLDLPALATAGTLLALAALLAALSPARRAVGLDPATALRHDG